MRTAPTPNGIHKDIQATRQCNHVQSHYECCLFTPADAQRLLQQMPRGHSSTFTKLTLTDAQKFMNIAIELFNKALEELQTLSQSPAMMDYLA